MVTQFYTVKQLLHFPNCFPGQRNPARMGSALRGKVFFSQGKQVLFERVGNNWNRRQKGKQKRCFLDLVAMHLTEITFLSTTFSYTNTRRYLQLPYKLFYRHKSQVYLKKLDIYVEFSQRCCRSRCICYRMGKNRGPTTGPLAYRARTLPAELPSHLVDPRHLPPAYLGSSPNLRGTTEEQRYITCTFWCSLPWPRTHTELPSHLVVLWRFPLHN